MPARLVNAGRGQSRLQITARSPEDDETARLAGWRANAQKPGRSSCRIRFRAGPFEATKSGIGGTRRPPPPTQILIRLPMPDMRTPGACAGPSCGTGGSTRPGGLTVPLRARGARRLLEQRTEEPPLRQPQQEHHRKPERQQRVSSCPHARRPEPAASRGHRVRDRASRDGHDERRPGASLAPLRRGRGAGVRVCAGPPAAERLASTAAVAGPRRRSALRCESVTFAYT